MKQQFNAVSGALPEIGLIRFFTDGQYTPPLLAFKMSGSRRTQVEQEVSEGRSVIRSDN